MSVKNDNSNGSANGPTWNTRKKAASEVKTTKLIELVFVEEEDEGAPENNNNLPHIRREF